jgi:mono/diheme cytochrome c family protein
MTPNPKSQSVTDAKAEPTAGNPSVPILLILAMGALFFWGSLYLDRHAGGFDQQVFEPYSSHGDLEANQVHDPVRMYINEGEDVFNRTCAACHQTTGTGKPGQYPPLAGSDWLQAATPERIGRIVLRGISGPIVVKAGGDPINLNGTMPPHGDVYDDEHLGAVLSYVRQAWGNHAGMIKPEQIAAIRKQVASHPGPFSPDELMKIQLAPPPAPPK